MPLFIDMVDENNVVDVCCNKMKVVVFHPCSHKRCAGSQCVSGRGQHILHPVQLHPWEL